MTKLQTNWVTKLWLSFFSEIANCWFFLKKTKEKLRSMVLSASISSTIISLLPKFLGQEKNFGYALFWLHLGSPFACDHSEKKNKWHTYWEKNCPQFSRTVVAFFDNIRMSPVSTFIIQWINSELTYVNTRTGNPPQPTCDHRWITGGHRWNFFLKNSNNSNFNVSNFDGHSFWGFMHVFTVILLLIDFWGLPWWPG